MHKSSEYRTYMAAMSRCNNPKTLNYSSYGGRGIKFRFTSFEQFIDEIGRRPSRCRLDRIDNDGNYEPGNVKWSSIRESNLNRRIRKDNSSGHKGVRWYASRGKWGAYIWVNYHYIHLGLFATKKSAISARLEAEAKYNAH
jgi:hypothetical protein